MPENNPTDPITDQEKAFINLVLSGTMTDRRAAKAVGFHPASAAHIKSSPRVRAYMLQHSAAIHQQQTVERDTGLPPLEAVGRAMEGQSHLIPTRDQILARLWEIANLSHEMTRNSITGQLKAISMIIAIEGLIPDRRAAAAHNQPAPPPVTAQIYQAEWLRKQRGEMEPKPPTSQEESASQPQPASGWADDAAPVSGQAPEPTQDLIEPAISDGPVNPEPTPSLAPRVPMADYVAPDTWVPRSLSMRVNPFGRRR